MARETACRYETQRRLYLDWNSFGKPGKLLHSVVQAEVYDMAAGDGEGQEQGENMVDSVTGRCSKCGSKRHESHGWVLVSELFLSLRNVLSFFCIKITHF